MKSKKILLLLSFVATTILLTNCKQKDPTVINEQSAKLLAVCEGQTSWASQEIYNYTIEMSILKKDTIADYSSEDFENLKVLQNRECCQYGCEIVTGNELYAFLQKGTIPEETRVVKNTSQKKDLFDGFLDAVFDVDDEEQDDMKSKTEALKLVRDFCYGHFDDIKDMLCSRIHIYDYRKNENSSNNKVTVYDVIYVLSDCYFYFCNDNQYGYLADKYVWCTIYEMKDGTFELKYINSSHDYADLEF